MQRRAFDKYLDKGLRGWIVQTAQQNYWRVAAWYDLDDLIADGYLAFAITKSRYGARVENKAHFMSLFKRVYMSLITDLANKRSKQEAAGAADIAISQIAVPGQELVALEYLGGGTTGEAELGLAISKAPAEIKLLLTELNEGYLRGRHPQKKRNGTRETTNQWLNRMLGTCGYDFEGQLRALLLPGQIEGVN